MKPMKKLLLILCLLLLPTLLHAGGGMMLGIVGGGATAAPPAGGNLLVGYNVAADVGEEANFNATYMYVARATAVATGYATKGYAHAPAAASAITAKMCIFTAAEPGILLKVSSPASYGGSAAWFEFTFDGTLQINSGTAYLVGIIGDATSTIDRKNDGEYEAGYDNDNAYTTPEDYTEDNALYRKVLIYVTD